MQRIYSGRSLSVSVAPLILGRLGWVGVDRGAKQVLPNQGLDFCLG